MINLDKVAREQLEQVMSGPIWDGDLISKAARDKLVEDGLAINVDGAYNCITGKGIKWGCTLGLGGTCSPKWGVVLEALQNLNYAYHGRDCDADDTLHALMTAYDDWLD